MFRVNRVLGSGFWGKGLRPGGLKVRVWRLGFRVTDLGFRV
jgi:hypothetical protein